MSHTRESPYFYIIKEQYPDLETKESDEFTYDDGKKIPYYVLELQDKPKDYFILEDEEYKCFNQHVTVFNNKLLSPMHYTAVYEHVSSGIKIHIHIYYDKDGNYLYYTIYYYKTKNKFVINPDPNNIKEVENGIKALGKKNGGVLLADLSANFHKKQKEYEKLRTDSLLELDRLSQDEAKGGIKSQPYQSKLVEVIRLLQAYHPFQFDPDLSTIKILENFENKSIPQYRISHKTIDSSLEEKKKDVEQVECNITKTSDPQQNEKTLTPTIPSYMTINLDENSSKNRQNSKLLLEKEYKLENILKKEFDTENQFSDANIEILSAFRKLDAIKKMRPNMMLQACIENDEEILRHHLAKIDDNHDALWLPVLLGTCVYYKRIELFDIIFNSTKNHFIKYTICGAPPKVEYGIPIEKDTEQSGIVSLLEIAFRNNDLSFFKLLLEKYHYDPNSSYGHHENIIEIAFLLQRNGYIEALLNAGANPNAMNVEKKICYNIYIDKNNVPNQQQVTIICANIHPIVHALHSNNMIGLKLLLENKAYLNTKIPAIGDLTSFGMFLVYALSRDIHKIELVEKMLCLFLTHGHTIDELQTCHNITPLQFCLGAQTTEANIVIVAKLLLKHGADRNKIDQNLNLDLTKLLKAYPDTAIDTQEQKVSNESYVKAPQVLFQPKGEIEAPKEENVAKATPSHAPSFNVGSG